MKKEVAICREGDRFTGIISHFGKKMTNDFEEWLTNCLNKYKKKSVQISIQTSPEKNVKIIEYRKETIRELSGDDSLDY